MFASRAHYWKDAVVSWDSLTEVSTLVCPRFFFDLTIHQLILLINSISTELIVRFNNNNKELIVGANSKVQ